jgi:type IV pilus assembly protein PilC
MPVYTYTARDAAGNIKTGSVDARTNQSAIALLKERGVYVISLNEKNDSFFNQLGNIRGVPGSDLVAMSRQLATMVAAGLPISKTLDVLLQQTNNATLRKVLTECLRDVEGGTPLSAAFGRHPTVFSPTFQALVHAGESSGKLDEVLLRIAVTMEAEQELNSKFKTAMVYPVIVIGAMVLVFFGMVFFVIPRLADMYESLNVPLPMITQFMINLSKWMTKYWYVFLILAAAMVFAIKTFLSSQVGKEFRSQFAFKAPVFGRITKLKEYAQFTRTLGLLISAAIPIVEALNIVAQVSGNSNIRRATREAALNVEKGNSLSDYLKKSPIFPPLVGQMVSVGEETGKVDEMLTQISAFYDRETDHAVKGLSAALEPLILIMLGVMVAILIISIIVPIYKITSAL